MYRLSENPGSLNILGLWGLSGPVQGELYLKRYFFFLCSYHLTSFQDPALSNANVASISEVRMSAMFLLAIVESYQVAASHMTFLPNLLKIGEVFERCTCETATSNKAISRTNLNSLLLSTFTPSSL
jgi:hypothetical protein